MIRPHAIRTMLTKTTAEGPRHLSPTADVLSACPHRGQGHAAGLGARASNIQLFALQTSPGESVCMGPPRSDETRLPLTPAQANPSLLGVILWSWLLTGQDRNGSCMDTSGDDEVGLQRASVRWTPTPKSGRNCPIKQQGSCQVSPRLVKSSPSTIPPWLDQVRSFKSPCNGSELPVWDGLSRAHAFPGVFNSLVGKKQKVWQAHTLRNPWKCPPRRGL